MPTNYSDSEKHLLKRFGERLKFLREKAGFSQEKLSFEAGLDRTYIGSVERGERNVSLINLSKIALALKTDLPSLLSF